MGRAPDLAVLGEAAFQAGGRGPHQHGWAWLSGSSWGLERGTGPLTRSVPQGAAEASLVVAHARLATTGTDAGDTPPIDEAQPYRVGSVVVAHNGNYPGWREEAAERGWTVTVDSEVIARLFAGGHLLDLIIPPEPLEGHGAGTGPHALLASRADGVLLALRRRGQDWPAHPLWHLRRPEGSYVSSRAFAPGCEPLPEGVTVVTG